MQHGLVIKMCFRKAEGEIYILQIMVYSTAASISSDNFGMTCGSGFQVHFSIDVLIASYNDAVVILPDQDTVLLLHQQSFFQCQIVNGIRLSGYYNLHDFLSARRAASGKISETVGCGNSV